MSILEQGLKTHMKRKHTKNDIEYPKSCELSDYDLESCKELKHHMKTHLCKRVDYKCEDCDFCGTNSMTMEVHLGKAHCETFECGLCESEMKDLETFRVTFIHM